jgi:DNA polymerase III subunit gamma/tau
MAAMSSLVLARKYRPRSFAEMVGQDHVVQALTHALTQQRLHHAYLFTGTRGIGKTTVSRILAKSLNCIGPQGDGGITAQPCGVCPACTAIDADRYLDYTEMDAASNRGIEEARDLIERASYKPSVGRFKVFMIDEAHQLTKDAFNALLKTLEEPPEYLKFVLATTDPEKMLPTVLSRCLQFNLRPMAPETVQSHLQRVLQAEQVAFEEGALRVLGRAARGSMRDALSLTDQAIAFGGGQVLEQGVRAMLGAVDRSHCHELVQALAAHDAKALLQRVDHLRQHGLSASGTLEEMARLLQQMAVASAVPQALDAADSEQVQAQQLATLLAADEIQLLYSIVLRGRAELSLMSDEYGALTMVLLRYLAFPSRGAPRPVQVAAPPQTPAPVPLKPVPQALSQVAVQPVLPAPSPPAAVAGDAFAPAKVAVPPPVAARPTSRAAEEPPPWMDEAPPLDDEQAPAPAPRSAPLRVAEPAALRVQAPAPLPAFSKTPLGDAWAAVVTELRERNLVTALVRELAMQAELMDAQGEGPATCWTLVVERESLRNDGFVAKLAAAIEAIKGHSVQLRLQAGVAQDSPARREAAGRAERQAQAEAVIQNDSLVQTLLAQFKSARIVPGSIQPD